jgi:hypothetical protein
MRPLLNVFLFFVSTALYAQRCAIERSEDKFDKTVTLSTSSQASTEEMRIDGAVVFFATDKTISSADTTYGLILMKTKRSGFVRPGKTGLKVLFEDGSRFDLLDLPIVERVQSNINTLIAVATLKKSDYLQFSTKRVTDVEMADSAGALSVALSGKLVSAVNCVLEAR